MPFIGGSARKFYQLARFWRGTSHTYL